MATTTGKLGLRKPDPDPSTGDLINVTTDINNSMDIIDAAVGTFGCTSGTRPTGGQRWDGRVIYETDTRRTYMWVNGLATWLPLLISRGTNGPYQLGTSTDTSGEGFNAEGGLTTTHFWRTRVVGDAQPRFVIEGNGGHHWGGGAAGTDVSLQRTATSVMEFIGGALKVSGDYVCGSENGVSGIFCSSGQESTSSTTYVNWGISAVGAITNFSFTKRFASTRVRFDMESTFFCNALDTGPMFGVNINSTDYDLARNNGAVPAINSRITTSGFRYVSGIPAGTYTVTGRIKRTIGTGNIFRDLSDWVSMSARECN